MQHPYIAAVRAAFVARLDAAYDREQDRIAEGKESRFGFCGLPYGMIAAGCWLVQHGLDGPACRAEQLTNWGPRRYRQYLETRTPEQLADELEEGRRVLFEGRRPIFVEPARVAA